MTNKRTIQKYLLLISGIYLLGNSLSALTGGFTVFSFYSDGGFADFMVDNTILAVLFIVPYLLVLGLSVFYLYLVFRSKFLYEVIACKAEDIGVYIAKSALLVYLVALVWSKTTAVLSTLLLLIFSNLYLSEIESSETLLGDMRARVSYLTVIYCVVMIVISLCVIKMVRSKDD